MKKILLSLFLSAAGFAYAQAPAFNFYEIDAANVESDNTLYYQGATSYQLGAIGVCEYPYTGTNANAGYVTDYISCYASYRNGSTEAYANRQVGAQLIVEDEYTSPVTGGVQVWARYEADCPNPNGHWIFNRVYSC